MTIQGLCVGWSYKIFAFVNWLVKAFCKIKKSDPSQTHLLTSIIMTVARYSIQPILTLTPTLEVLHSRQLQRWATQSYEEINGYMGVA